jgi:hypothetical protein
VIGNHSAPRICVIDCWAELFALAILSCKGIEMAGGVFISYRREDAAMAALAIRGQLASTLGAGAVFLDSTGLPAGDDWKRDLDQRIDSCAVLLAVIGKKWVSPRLAEPGDVVRTEIETALRRGVRVIPVLVDGVERLDEKELPDSLKPLSSRQWVRFLNLEPEYALNELSGLLSRVLRGIDRTAEPAPTAAATEPPKDLGPGGRPAKATAEARLRSANERIGKEEVKHFFISCCSEDEAEAQSLVDDLEKRGPHCWLAARDVQFNYQKEIVEAISRAQALIVVISEQANSSDEIPKEISLARKYKVRTIPVRIEDAWPSGALEYELSNVQNVDLFKGRDTGINKLIRLLGPTGAQEAANVERLAREREKRESAEAAEAQRQAEVEAARRAEEDHSTQEAATAERRHRRSELAETLPALNDRSINRICKVIDAAFINPRDLDNLLVFSLGEELRDACLGDSAAGGHPAIDLVKALHAGGLLEQFLCSARMARPESKDLEGVIDECYPRATKSGEPTTEVVQAVLTGIECASRLRTESDFGPAVAERLGNSQKLLSGIPRDLNKLKAYKTLHDVLQRVQIERYPVVVAQIKRLGEDPSVLDEFSSNVDALRKLCIDAGNAAATLKDIGANFAPELSWIRTLSATVQDLEAAAEKLDRTGARGAALTIRNILAKHLARMDYELRGTAESLRLNNLISTLAAVAAIRGLTEAEKAPLEAAKANLQKLNGYLGGRVAVHNRWQDVENQLWAADEEFERTPSAISDDFTLLWGKAKTTIAPLWGLEPKAEWVSKTKSLLAETDALLSASPPQAPSVQNKFRKFRNLALYEFFRVDRSLNAFCDQILALGQPVASLLDG